MRPNKVWKKPWRILAWCLVLIWVIFCIPALEKALRPGLVRKIARMVDRTTFADCEVKVDRDDDVSLLVTIRSGKAAPIRTEVS